MEKNMPTSATVERWADYEWVLEGPQDGNPFRDVTLAARFTHLSRSLDVAGFYDGDGRYIVRLMPDMTGTWQGVTASNSPELDNRTLTLTCTTASPGNHGPVRVSNTWHFSYEDGTPYLPFGTTCYVWNHQGDALEEQTIRTLDEAPFNKMRMCVFPKHYTFNSNEPEYYPFVRSQDGSWDFTRPEPAFYRHLERRIRDLRDRGIEADLILFHPYDRWGFAAMTPEQDDAYLDYVVRRLAAYRNVWWSFANEYDLMTKTTADWERLAQLVVTRDPWQHLRSIHNCRHFYDHTRPWITHCSIQRTDNYRTSEYVNEWRQRYRKPVVVDECAYEGNISNNWGNITAEEMVRRFWEGAVRGGYVGHGETYMHPQDILWWSKGGTLHGQSPARIAFLRRIQEEAPVAYLDDAPAGSGPRDLPCAGQPGRYYLYYYGFNQPTSKTFTMQEGVRYRASVIDTWAMTIRELPGTYTGHFTIDLPGKPYMAVRLEKAGD